MLSFLQSCVYGENRTSIQCTTPSLAKLALQPPVVTKVAFVLDGYLTDQLDLIYVEDPRFQDPKLTSKDNKSIVELKVSCPTLSSAIIMSKKLGSHTRRGIFRDFIQQLSQNNKINQGYRHERV